MRFLIMLLLIAASLVGCAPHEAETFREHAQYAGAKAFLETTLYRPAADGSLLAESKRLPWQADMEAYLLSFVLAESNAQYACRRAGDLALVDIANFPACPDAASEGASVAAIVNTLLSLPGVQRVQLTFDGDALLSLPHGTNVNGTFSDQIVTGAP